MTSAQVMTSGFVGSSSASVSLLTLQSLLGLLSLSLKINKLKKKKKKKKREKRLISHNSQSTDVSSFKDTYSSSDLVKLSFIQTVLSYKGMGLLTL